MLPSFHHLSSFLLSFLARILARLMSTRTTLLSTDSLAMYGLNVKYEIHS